jgi:hypothetical protein
MKRILVMAALVALGVGIVVDAVGGAPLLRTVFAGALVLLAPGWLVLRAHDGAAERPIGREIALALCISWVILALLCAAAFTLHLPISYVVGVLAVAAIALLLLVLRRGRGWAITATPLERLALAGIAAAAVAAYSAGGYTSAVSGPAIAPGWSSMEEALQISTVRKIASADALAHDQVMYVKGGYITYFVPVYPFMLAIIGVAANLDPMLLYDTFRFWSASLGLIAFWWLAVAVVGRERGVFVALAAAALVLLGHAGQAEELGSWGQLVPVTHIADFALGVLLPLALAMLAAIAVQPMRWRHVIGVIAFIAAMTLTHVREAPHALSYIAAYLPLSLLLGSSRRRSWWQQAAIAAASVGIAMAYGAFIQARVPFIDFYNDAASSQGMIDLLSQYRTHGIKVNPDIVPKAQGPIATLAYLFLPLVLLTCRHHPGLIFLAAGMLAWWLPMYVPIAGYALQQLTYSEIMMAPSRYILAPAYLFSIVGAVAVTAWMQQAAVWRRWFGESRAPFVAVGLAAAATVLGAEALYRVTRPLPALVIGLGLAAAVLITRRAASAATREFLLPDFAPPGRRVVGAAIVAFIVLLAVRMPRASWIEQGWARERPHTSDTRAWFESTEVSKVLSWNTVGLLNAIPPRSMILADPTMGLAIPLVTDQFIFSSGSAFTTDLPYLRVVQGLAGESFDSKRHVQWNNFRHILGERLTPLVADEIVRAESVRNDFSRLVYMAWGVTARTRPIFGEEATDDMSIEIMQALRPDYVLIDIERHSRLARVIESRPAMFQAVGADRTVRLFKFTS